MRRFDGADNWKDMHTYTRKLLHLKFNLQFIQHNIFLPSWCCIKKEGCSPEIIVQSFTKRKKIRRNSATPPPCRELFTKRISSVLIRGFCYHLVEIEDVITPRKITLFKYKSWTEQRIKCRQKCRYFEDICFSFRGRTQINSKRGEQLRQSNFGGEVGGFWSHFTDKF